MAILTMLSPASRPADAAGDPGETDPITAAGLAMPPVMTSDITTPIARMKFIVTPAMSTNTLARNGFDSNQRFSGTGFGPKGTSAS